MLYFYCKIMITNFLIFFKKSPLLAFIKFEPTFLTGSLAVCLSAPVQGEAGGRGVWGEFRPPSPASSVRIFSNRHRQFSEFGFWATFRIRHPDGVFARKSAREHSHILKNARMLFMGSGKANCQRTCQKCRLGLYEGQKRAFLE